MVVKIHPYVKFFPALKVALEDHWAGIDVIQGNGNKDVKPEFLCQTQEDKSWLTIETLITERIQSFVVGWSACADMVSPPVTRMKEYISANDNEDDPDLPSIESEILKQLLETVGHIE